MKTSKTLTALAVVALGSASHAAVITQWDFNGTSATTVPGGATGPTPAIGTGTASLMAGNTATFASGTASGGSSDPVTTTPPNYAWNVTSFATQGTGDKSRGVEFKVSTLGYENIIVSWDQRHSNTAARHVQFQYTTDGSTWTDWGTLFEATAGDTWFNGRTVDLSSIAAVDDNADFAFRIVATFEPSTSAYAPSNPTSTYGTGGTWRFDMVTVSGTVVPEPHEYAAMAGLGLLGFAVWRRSRQA